jgi:hypothetical protein
MFVSKTRSFKIDNAPDIETIQKLFNDHIETHSKLPESARLRDIRGEKDLIKDYSGRVVYELLQNALDRCEKKVFIALDNGRNSLFVGNDGSPVSARERVVDNVPAKEASDFHALLSLHSSTKSARENIGNKGVGFRSVFASSNKVAVWSRCSNGTWWSLEMAHPSIMKPAQGVRWEDNQVASFYNPSLRFASDDSKLAELLNIDESLHEHLSSLVTMIVLPEIAPEHIDDSKDIVTSIRQLQELTLGFLREKYPKKNTVIDVMMIEASKDSHHKSKKIDFENGWIDIRGESVPLNDATREKSGLDLIEAQVTIALPPFAAADQCNKQGYYWSYLPTEQLAGFGIHIHADFYLNNSRRNVTFRLGNSNEPQFYNGSLLQSAAKAIVFDLWRDARVLGRDDFWQLANPNSCKCEQLKILVAAIFLQKEHFTRIVADSFPSSGKWKLCRYKELFKAVNDWADYLHRHQVEGIKQGKPTMLRERIWEYVRDSKSPVFPVIGVMEDSDLVGYAIALQPKLEAGGSVREMNVYYRSSNSQDADWFELPEAVKRQKSYVTSFRPEGMSDSDCGMVDYNRVEILGRLKPGITDDDHRELLKVALRLSIAERGEQESVLDRCLKYRTPGWRFLLEAESNGKMTNLLRASNALSELHVPTLGRGWLPAHEVTVDMSNEAGIPPAGAESDCWPWPVVDFTQLKEIVSEIEHTSSVDADKLCILLGITPGPLLVTSKDGLRLDSFGSKPMARNRVFAAIITSWDTFLGPLCKPELLPLLCKQIQNEKWIPAYASVFDENICGGILKAANGYVDAYVEPHRIWFERAQGGFRTEYLTVLCSKGEKKIPDWAWQCGIVEVGQKDATASKIFTALRDLQRLNYTKATSELYTRLIKSINEEEDSSELPILARYFKNGKLQKIDWACKGEKVYYDNGDHTTYISGFENIAVWAVRRHKQKIAGKLGITTFNPNKVFRKKGDRNQDIEQRLRMLIARAMPDIIAATGIFSQQSEAFDEDKALQKWAKVQFEHYDDVWMDLQQEGLEGGHLGLNEKGNIFPLTESNTLVFDLGATEDFNQFLLECAAPLAEVLCDNKAFITVFSQVLTAWSHAEGANGNEVPASVLRLRRDFGTDDEDITAVSKKIATYVISDEEKHQWQIRINSALSSFGEPNGSDVQLGITVTQKGWSDFRLDVPCNQQLVQDKLKECLSDISTGREFLIPAVDFISTNRQRLIELSKSNLNNLLAQKAVSNKLPPDEVQLLPLEHDRITSLLESNDALALSEPKPTDDQLEHILRQLVGIGDIAVQDGNIDKILTFLRNRTWPIDESSIVSESLVAGQFKAPNASAPLKPMDDEVRIKSDRLKAIEGDKAEVDLLSLAEERAREWLKEDENGFWTGLTSTLTSTLAGNLDKEIGKLIAERDRFADVLQVSKWWGNAGYDLLLPEKSTDNGWSFLHVEVKRVSADSGQFLFHLSENERIKAMDAAQKDPLWRLWLLSLPDCKVRDVTCALPDSTMVNELVSKLRDCGMRPESYLTMITYPLC